MAYLLSLSLALHDEPSNCADANAAQQTDNTIAAQRDFAGHREWIGYCCKCVALFLEAQQIEPKPWWGCRNWSTRRRRRS